MKRALVILALSPAPLLGQAPPRAQVAPVEAQEDGGTVFFQRAKNLYDSARSSNDQPTRVAQFDRAAVLFTEYLNVYSNHPNAEMAWWYLGNSFYQNGRVDEGKRCFHTLLNRFGRGEAVSAAALTLAADHYNKGEYAFAAPLFERYATNAAKPEETPRGHYFAGTCYRMLQRDREALSSFRKVIEDPAGTLFVPQAKVGMGYVLLRSAKFHDALANFEEVVADGSTTPKLRGEAALQASLAATKLDQGELAEKYLKLILTTESMSEYWPDAQTGLMANQLARKNYDEVITLFRRSTVKAEGEKEAARLMIAAKAYRHLKKPNEALTLFREVERLVKPDSELAFDASYYRLLCFFEIEGHHVPDQVDAFIQIYRKSRPEDPRIHTALLMKAETLFSAGNIAGAAKAYNEISATSLSDENRPGLLYQRGWCLAEAGDNPGAIRSFSEFIAKYPQDARIPSAHAKRAKAYAETGDSAKAIADFDQLTAAGAPPDLSAYAWLESARMRVAENNIADMIVRYKGLLGNVSNLSEKLQAEANYRIGWGLVKTNAGPEGIPYLEKARSLNPADYKKPVGILLALAYFSAQDQGKLAAELNLAIEGKYEADIPDQAMQWSGMQAFNAGDFATAARFLQIVSTPAEPRETAKEIWRYLGKARLETGDGEGALTAANNVLEVEENPAWKADGLVDKGRALTLLGRDADARTAADQAQQLHPPGRTAARLRILSGDLYFNANDFGTAAADYLNVVSFHEDLDLKPLALDKLIRALEKKGGETAKVEQYRAQLLKDYPDWKPR